MMITKSLKLNLKLSRNLDLHCLWNNELKAKLLCPCCQRADLLLAIPSFVVFGSFIHVLLAVLERR